MSKRVRQAKFFLKRSPFQKQRWLMFILLALVGAIATVSLHTTIASASSNRQVGSVVRAGGLGLSSREFHDVGQLAKGVTPPLRGDRSFSEESLVPPSLAEKEAGGLSLPNSPTVSALLSPSGQQVEHRVATLPSTIN